MLLLKRNEIILSMVCQQLTRSYFPPLIFIQLGFQGLIHMFASKRTIPCNRIETISIRRECVKFPVSTKTSLKHIYITYIACKVMARWIVCAHILPNGAIRKFIFSCHVKSIFQKGYTGCIKKCPNYKIASTLDICKITDTNSNQKLI